MRSGFFWKRFPTDLKRFPTFRKAVSHPSKAVSHLLGRNSKVRWLRWLVVSTSKNSATSQRNGGLRFSGLLDVLVSLVSRLKIVNAQQFRSVPRAVPVWRVCREFGVGNRFWETAFGNHGWPRNRVCFKNPRISKFYFFFTLLTGHPRIIPPLDCPKRGGAGKEC